MLHGNRHESDEIETTDEMRAVANTAKQRHHDYFVKLQLIGELLPEDQLNYDTAMEREEVGEVDPLPEED